MTTNADQARSDWHAILATEADDALARYILYSLIESVVVDIVTNKMATDDEFAEVVGRRIVVMRDATAAAAEKELP